MERSMKRFAEPRRALRAVLLLAILAPVAAVLPVQGAEGAPEVVSFTGNCQDRWGVGSVREASSGGFHFARLKSSGDGKPSLLSTPAGLSLDLTGRFVKIWLRVDDVERLAGLELRLFSGPGRFFAYAVPLFADARFNLLQAERWVPLTMSFGMLRAVGNPDRAAIDSAALYVEDRGAGAVRVDWGGLAGVSEPPHGVVSFTFDDGYDEHRTVAAPTLRAHGFAGTAYVMPDEIGQPDYMSARDLRALRALGWDLAAHHARPFTDFAPAQLEDAILGIRRYLLALGLGDGYEHLAFPLGRHDSQTVMPLVRKHFRTARIAGAGPETLPPADPHKLRALNVTPRISPQALGNAARRARANGEWLILMFHYLVAAPENDLEYGIRDFAAAVQAVADSGVAVQTVAEVWREQRAREATAISAAPETPSGPASVNHPR